MDHDVFICHASEDKNDFVRPLAEALTRENLDVWYDEFSLKVGDSLRETIDRGLASSNFGVVVLSPSFFQKRWAQRELNGLTARQIAEKRNVILPIWHQVDAGDILKYSPPLADIRAISSSGGIDQVVQGLVQAIIPDESPFATARKELHRFNFTSWNTTNHDLLRFTDIKGRHFDNYLDPLRWSFPLPDDFGKSIAWTALQWDWIVDEENGERINQLTPPERVHEFIDRYPALAEISYQNLDLLATYVPQLTFPQFSGRFGNDFDEYLLRSTQHWAKAPKAHHDAHHAVEGTALICDVELSFRLENFGNYKPRYVSRFYVEGETHRHRGQTFGDFQFLCWLLSHYSSWIPQKAKDYLLAGIIDSISWPTDLVRYGHGRDKSFWSYFNGKRKLPTKSTRNVIAAAVSDALGKLSFTIDGTAIANEIVERDFIGDYKRKLEDIRQSHRKR